nr:hypothetical protein [Bifidobacterium santillanense]
MPTPLRTLMALRRGMRNDGARLTDGAGERNDDTGAVVPLRAAEASLVEPEERRGARDGSKRRGSDAAAADVRADETDERPDVRGAGEEERRVDRRRGAKDAGIASADDRDDAVVGAGASPPVVRGDGDGAAGAASDSSCCAMACLPPRLRWALGLKLGGFDVIGAGSSSASPA